MTPDLSGFKVLMMVGKGFTPAQQAWPAITPEGFTQLGGTKGAEENAGPYAVVELDGPRQYDQAADNRLGGH